LFKTAGLILGDVEPADKGDLNDPGCVCKDDGGLLVIGTGKGT
jgi:hypothetical protein